VPRLVCLEPPTPPPGRVLLSYLREPLTWPARDRRLAFHSNLWESREIARCLVEMGYGVDAVAWDDRTWEPERPYDAVIDISTNLQRWHRRLPGRCLRLLHRTGSDPYFQNAAELARAEAFSRRTGRPYAAKRLVADPEAERASLAVADAVSLLGNRFTLETYPAALRQKMTPVPVSASPLGRAAKTAGPLVPPEREFLWFCGAGAVHKGLDLTLEAFARNRRLILNVVGEVGWESDFLAAYGRELRESENVRYHGFLRPSGRRFRTVLRRCVALVAPTCAEGTSPAVVTALQAGLYPILSRAAGVDLPDGCGQWLETCEIAEIEAAIRRVAAADAVTLAHEIGRVRDHARRRHSRAAFRDAMVAFLHVALGGPLCAPGAAAPGRAGSVRP